MSKIINQTKATLLADNFKPCNSILSKVRGLMFSVSKNLVFIYNKEQYVPLHMFFVFFPIDVIYLDSEKKVVDLKKHFLPFTLYNPKSKSKYVLELENGSINRSMTQIGDILNFHI